jgi:hypothetical protein
MSLLIPKTTASLATHFIPVLAGIIASFLVDPNLNLSKQITREDTISQISGCASELYAHVKNHTRLFINALLAGDQQLVNNFMNIAAPKVDDCKDKKNNNPFGLPSYVNINWYSVIEIACQVDNPIWKTIWDTFDQFDRPLNENRLIKKCLIGACRGGNITALNLFRHDMLGNNIIYDVFYGGNLRVIAFMLQEKVIIEIQNSITVNICDSQIGAIEGAFKGGNFNLGKKLVQKNNTTHLTRAILSSCLSKKWINSSIENMKKQEIKIAKYFDDAKLTAPDIEKMVCKMAANFSKSGPDSFKLIDIFVKHLNLSDRRCNAMFWHHVLAGAVTGGHLDFAKRAYNNIKKTGVMLDYGSVMVSACINGYVEIVAMLMEVLSPVKFLKHACYPNHLDVIVYMLSRIFIGDFNYECEIIECFDIAIRRGHVEAAYMLYGRCKLIERFSVYKILDRSCSKKLGLHLARLQPYSKWHDGLKLPDDLAYLNNNFSLIFALENGARKYS